MIEGNLALWLFGVIYLLTVAVGGAYEAQCHIWPPGGPGQVSIQKSPCIQGFNSFSQKKKGMLQVLKCP